MEFFGKTYVSENKLYSIVVNVTKELSEVRQAWLFNSVNSDIMSNRNFSV